MVGSLSITMTRSRIKVRHIGGQGLMSGPENIFPRKFSYKCEENVLFKAESTVTCSLAV